MTARDRTGPHRVPEQRDGDDPVSPRRRTRAVAGRDDRDGSVVEFDREPRRRRWSSRRLAPVGIGGAAVLAGALVFTMLQPGTQGPDLASAMTTNDDSSRRSVSDSGLSSDGAGALSGVMAQAGEGVEKAEAAEKAEREKAATEKRTAPSDEGASGSGRAAAAPVAGAAQVAGDGTQAALKHGWGAAGGDEFSGTALGDGWTAYDGAGHAGNGRRTPDAVTVENGNLVIRGDGQGNTGGVAFGEDRQYGKWEMRAKFPKGDAQYHPVLLLWPQSGDGSNGEVDFAETNSAADDVSFFLHHGGGQDTETKALDITQWHNYAVEWTPDGVRGYIDGEQWFSSGTQPSGPVHPTIQLDWFPEGGSAQPSELQVAWMRQYQ